MIYHFDTNAVSDLMTGQTKIRDRFSFLSRSHQFSFSAIVRGELRYGLERVPAGRRRGLLQARFDVIVGQIPIDLVDQGVAETYGQVKYACELAGLPRDANDLWIAAAAITRGAILITRDADFNLIPKLRTEDWSR